jgi:hypothetical protein
MEFHTGNPVCTIHALAQEMECAGIVLVVRGGVGLLLATHEVKELLEEKSIPLYIIQLHEKNSTFSLPQWLSRWFRSTALREPSMTSLHTPANDIQKIFFMKDES